MHHTLRPKVSVFSIVLFAVSVCAAAQEDGGAVTSEAQPPAAVNVTPGESTLQQEESGTQPQQQEPVQEIAQQEQVPSQPAVAQQAVEKTTENSKPDELRPGNAPSAVSTLYQLENTLNSVLDTLVEQKLLTKEQAEAIVKSAEEKAKQRMNESDKPRQTVVEEKPPAPGEKVIRVPYVPEHVKQELRDEISNGLREDTVEAVLGQARQERWGMPGVTPEWVGRIKWFGDIRVRAQFDRYDENNAPYFDFQAINEQGGVAEAGQDAFLNTTENRERLRVRARLGMNAKVTNGLTAKFRITTGNIEDPVSTNQTLGSYANKFGVVWDQAYLQYDGTNADAYPYLTLLAGRMKNPWYSTDLVWDSDLAFDGLAFTYRMNLRGSEDLLEMTENDRTLMLTLGAFPLEEIELSDKDKWLYGAQVRTELIFENQSTFNFAAAYYVYDNITGQINEENDDFYDFTAPAFLQKGNTLFNITTNTTGDGELFALASDYELINLMLKYDLAAFSPYHVIIGLDYVDNMGYDKEKIAARTQGRPLTNTAEDKTEAYMVEVAFGWPKVTLRGNWRVALAYKYVEQDAVLDAFTDSDFHLGGTDAKGYVFRWDYGLMENAWFTLRYLSANEIDGPPLAIDVIQLDVNAKF
jgi:hypothetical protein